MNADQMKTDPKKSPRASTPAKLEFHPLTPERWSDLVALFGTRGACGGCWCMWWRLTRGEFNEGKGDGNKRALKRIVDSGALPGMLAYADGEPAGWCAIAPRKDYSRLERSRILQPVDAEPVWSVTCFFIAKGRRKRGLSVALLDAAVTFAGDRGASIVEGYPIDSERPTPDVFANTGLVSAFRRANFAEAARRSPTRPIMRISTKRGRSSGGAGRM